MKLFCYFWFAVSLVSLLSMQKVVACSTILGPGCEYCRNHLQECGVTKETAAAQLGIEILTEQIKEQIKTSCRDDLKNCGVNESNVISQYPDVVTEAGKNKGKEECRGNLISCGVSESNVISQYPNVVTEAGKNKGKEECRSDLISCGAPLNKLILNSNILYLPIVKIEGGESLQYIQDVYMLYTPIQEKQLFQLGSYSSSNDGEVQSTTFPTTTTICPVSSE